MNYKEIIKNVLQNGVAKEATRLDADGKPVPVENGTFGTFCEVFRHDMSKGFPLTTLRKMPWRSIRVELEGFIKGVTDKKWYQDRKCGFWNEWANPLAVKKIMDGHYNIISTGIDYPIPIKKDIQAREADLGPIYGYQWRAFGEHYGKKEKHGGSCYFTDSEYSHVPNGVLEGTDQLQNVVTKLKTSPYDRRMVVSAWNPNQEHMMALPSCHVLWNVVVYGNKLNLVWHQRSCDLMLGVGANIASYGLLLMLLCEEAGLEPGELVGTLADCHIYNNHRAAAEELAGRTENELPQVKIERKSDGSFNIFDWTWHEVELEGYNPLEKVDVGAVTV